MHIQQFPVGAWPHAQTLASAAARRDSFIQFSFRGSRLAFWLGLVIAVSCGLMPTALEAQGKLEAKRTAEVATVPATTAAVAESGKSVAAADADAEPASDLEVVVETTASAPAMVSVSKASVQIGRAHV